MKILYIDQYFTNREGISAARSHGKFSGLKEFSC